MYDKIFSMTKPDHPPSFWVDNIPIYGDAILSPMDGFSDLPFRSICRRLGSAISYTEFVNAIDVINHKPSLELRLAHADDEHPVVYQLFDDSPERLVQAAQQLQERQPDIIDINMGCSVNRIAGRGAGAGLLTAPKKVAQIFSTLNKSLDIPVTGKIRLGWDDKSLNYLEIAKIIEDNGGQLIAVHARTKAQGYSGEADWDAIAEIKLAVSIPVIGNGDIKKAADIDRMKSYTGCDAVMIGRAAIGNPWIFSRKDREDVPNHQVKELMVEHLNKMMAYYGDDFGLLLFRKHVKQYISPYRLTQELRVRLLTCETTTDFLALLDRAVGEGLPETA
ncbi:MAG: tRNA dihydrouridine synthase DusB [Chloroflexota bacterium]